MNCETCQAKLPTLQSNVNRVNAALHSLGLFYHVTLSGAAHLIDAALLNNGFVATPLWPSGNDGSLHEDVGHGKWVTVTWHRMESGRYEVIPQRFRDASNYCDHCKTERRRLETFVIANEASTRPARR